MYYKIFVFFFWVYIRSIIVYLFIEGDILVILILKYDIWICGVVECVFMMRVGWISLICKIGLIIVGLYFLGRFGLVGRILLLVGLLFWWILL